LLQTGAAHLEAGGLAKADRYASMALGLARQHGGRGDEAWALHLLGEIAARREPPERERALEPYDQALALAEELGMAPLQARCHLSLGALHHRAGHAEQAQRELTRAVEMLGAMQMRPWLRTAEALLASSR
jgi:tetratricopeptide (TPR) repeat protein